MDSSKILAAVQVVVAQTFGLPESEITSSSGIGNPPAWDSFGHMQLVSAVEERFSISFPSYKLSELQDVQAIAAAVAELTTA
jgi:acyl carrier protein